MSKRMMMFALALLLGMVLHPLPAASAPGLAKRILTAVPREVYFDLRDTVRDPLWRVVALSQDAAVATDSGINIYIGTRCPTCYEGGPLFHGQSLKTSGALWLLVDFGVQVAGHALYRHGDWQRHTWMKAVGVMPSVFLTGAHITGAVRADQFWQGIKHDKDIK